MRGVLLAEVAPDWLLEQMDAEWADRYQKRFSDFRLPKDATERVALAETIGADGRQLLERIYAETNLPWLRELDAVETLRRVWLQHYHASPQGTPWRADGELPPSALLITSPYDVEARYSRKKSTTWTGYKVHFTEMCETNEPHLIVDVITTAATTPDGEIMEELHEQLAQQEMLPAQHLVDMGYVDAEVLAQSQSRYQVEVVGPVMPDVSWQTKAATGFDHRQFTIDWQAHQVTCPTSHTRKTLGNDFRSSWETSHPGAISGIAVCQACPFHDQCTHSPARVLILQPNEQAYRARKSARVRELTPECRALYAKRAGVEGTMAQAVRTCEMRRARYIGSKKLRLQAFFTATAMNVLRACAWMEEGIHASTPVSRFARLVASAKSVAAA